MINKKKFWIILSVSVLLSAGITYFLTKKEQPEITDKSQVLRDSIVSLEYKISEYEKTIGLANDYFLGKNILETETFEQHQDTLISTTIKNLRLHQNTEQAESIKIVSQVIVDTLVQIEKDIKTEQELSKVKSELATIKEEMSKPKRAKEILNIVSSKGKKIQYVGEVQNGNANGYGEGIFETGSVYKGHWKDNLRHGKGVFTWEDEEYYEGNFVEGKREGYGEYYWKNGEVYKGFWKNDMRHGEGVIYKKNGKIKQEGTWENDELK